MTEIEDILRLARLKESKKEVDAEIKEIRNHLNGFLLSKAREELRKNQKEFGVCRLGVDEDIDIKITVPKQVSVDQEQMKSLVVKHPHLLDFVKMEFKVTETLLKEATPEQRAAILECTTTKEGLPTIETEKRKGKRT